MTRVRARSALPGESAGSEQRIAANEALTVQAAGVFEPPALLIGDPLAALPVMGTSCVHAPVFLASPGPGGSDGAGGTQVYGFRKDGVRLDFLLDFDPFGAASGGNDVAAGDLDGVLGENTHEIAVSRGPDPSADTLVKIYDLGAAGWATQASFYAFATSGYGVNIDVGRVRNTMAPDDIVTGRGPGATFAPTVRVWEKLGGVWQSGTNNQFSAYSCPACIYGVDGDGRDEILVGKGWVNPSGPPVPANDEDVAIWGFDEISATYVHRLTIDDPFRPFYNDPALFAGARAIGYAGDASAGDEVLVVAHGRITHENTLPWETPPNVEHGRVLGFKVTPGTPWTYDTAPLLDKIVYESESQGVRLSRIKSMALEIPYGFADAGGDTPADAPPRAPVRPWQSAAAVAGQTLRAYQGAPPDIFTGTGQQVEMLARLDQVRSMLAAGQLQAARQQAAALQAALGRLVGNATSLREAESAVGDVARAIDQQLGNRPPIARGPGVVEYRTLPGVAARATLDASASEDPDSTMSTHDNIVAYRWYDESGRYVGDREQWLIDLAGSETGAVVHPMTLEVEDAYGATGRTMFDIWVIPEVGP